MSYCGKVDSSSSGAARCFYTVLLPAASFFGCLFSAAILDLTIYGTMLLHVLKWKGMECILPQQQIKWEGLKTYIKVGFHLNLIEILKSLKKG